MGYLFQGNCYATNAKAVDAFYTSSGPQFFQTGTTTSSQLFYYSKYVNGWYVCSESVTGTTAPTCQTATSPDFPLCDDTNGFNDGVTLGWGIGLAMVIAWSYRLMQKATT